MNKVAENNMPAPGKQWLHVVINTYASWLPGDPRGFRSKNHRIHSSGDYKNPPPPGENAGLHQHAKRVSDERIELPSNLFERIGMSIRNELKKQECQVLAISVAALHVHCLAEMPVEPSSYRSIVGRCKTAACYAVRDEMPGRLWSRNGTYKLVGDRKHQINSYRYILNQSDAWTWSFKLEQMSEAKDTEEELNS